MIDADLFRGLLQQAGIDWFAGVPDSLLADLAPIDADIVTANEGSAIALAAGHHLATGKIGCVYLQSSGLGNAVNPLLSLADIEVYAIPMLLIIGWRGAPGEHDEPQHAAEGRTLVRLLAALDIPAEELEATPEAARRCLARAVQSLQDRSAPHALIVRRGTFTPRKRAPEATQSNSFTRERAIELVTAAAGEDLIVCTTGMASRELFELRQRKGQTHARDFLNSGAMGHASQIALGMAMARPSLRVWVIDGDGAALMHLGGLALIGARAPANLRHVLINNGVHASVGGQPTAAPALDFSAVAKACGYQVALKAESEHASREALSRLAGESGPSLLELRIGPGRRADLGRPSLSPAELKRLLDMSS